MKKKSNPVLFNVYAACLLRLFVSLVSYVYVGASQFYEIQSVQVAGFYL